MRQFIFMITILSVVNPAFAQEPDPPAKRLSGGHLAGAYFTGVLGELALGTLGGYLGYLSAGHCEEPADDDTFLGACFLHGLGETTAGVLIGTNLGSIAGVYGYGQLTGHQGSYQWTALGSIAGSLAGFGLALAIDSEAGLVAMGLLIPAGAVLGYTLSGPSISQEPLSTALLDLSPESGLRLGVPAVRWAQRGEDSRWSVHLLSGRF